MLFVRREEICDLELVLRLEIAQLRALVDVGLDVKRHAGRTHNVFTEIRARLDGLEDRVGHWSKFLQDQDARAAVEATEETQQQLNACLSCAEVFESTSELTGHLVDQHAK